MFNGLIREYGDVVSFDGATLQISSTLKPKIGDSIAVNGACLTVINVVDNIFSLSISSESKNILSTENFVDKVHIEDALKFGDKIDGHLIQGHIDTIGKISKISKLQNGVDFWIDVDSQFMNFIAPKGSIAVDGVSLTVNSVSDNSFRLTIISHTFNNTLFSKYQIDRRVHIETDMFARYIFNIINRNKELTWSDFDRMCAIF
jgi:riboflavin synthase